MALALPGLEFSPFRELRSHKFPGTAKNKKTQNKKRNPFCQELLRGAKPAGMGTIKIIRGKNQNRKGEKRFELHFVMKNS